MDGEVRGRLKREVDVLVRLRVELAELADRIGRLEGHVQVFSVRDLTAARRRRVVELREEGCSQQLIARTLGIARSTVQRDVSVTSHATPVRSVGLDGYSHPARKNGHAPL